MYISSSWAIHSVKDEQFAKSLVTPISRDHRLLTLSPRDDFALHTREIIVTKPARRDENPKSQSRRVFTPRDSPVFDVVVVPTQRRPMQLTTRARERAARN